LNKIDQESADNKRIAKNWKYQPEHWCFDEWKQEEKRNVYVCTL